MLTKTSNKIDARRSRPTTASATRSISALKAAGCKPIPVTGQDATAQGIQNILSGWQCMTVYKAVTTEAAAAATVADGCSRAASRSSTTARSNNGMRNVPSVLATPVAITKDNWKLLDHGRLPQEVRRLHGRRTRSTAK